MNKKKKVWIGVISIVLALLLFMVLMVIQQSMQEKPESKWVLCAKEGIPKSVVLTEENISVYTEKKEIPVISTQCSFIAVTSTPNKNSVGTAMHAYTALFSMLVPSGASTCTSFTCRTILQLS